MNLTFEKTSGPALGATEQPSRSHGVRTHIPPHSILFTSRAPFELREVGNSALDKAAVFFVMTCLVAIGLILGGGVAIGLLFFA